ncbi:MAG: hypothetical protein KF832_03430 [Caldilineaceae bacterium]|nr:hypothetical protein [Caldilineaceae bacterium]
MVPNAARYALAYLLWAISVVAAMAILLVSRSAVMIVLGLTPWNRYVEHALNQFGFLFLAIFGLAVVIFIEHFYRTGVEKNRLFARFWRVSLLELLVLMLLHLIRLVGETILGVFTPLALAVVVGEGLLALALFWLYRYTSQRASPTTS